MNRLPTSNTPLRVSTPPPISLVLSKESWSATSTPSSSASRRFPGAYPRAPYLSTHLTLEDVKFSNLAQTNSRSDVLTGKLIQSGRAVALKRIGKETSKRYSTEAEIWRTLNHVNVLEFIGILQTGEERFLVSPWEANGTLARYLRGNPNADRLRLLRETAAALVYLHLEVKIVHGNIRASNILVSNTITALLCDFGLSSRTGLHPPPESSSGESLRWLSPELIRGTSTTQSTFESDVYAFGMTIYQVLSGQVPFYESSLMEDVLNLIKRGDRPQKGPSPDGVTNDGVWEVGISCWAEDPRQRPGIDVAYAQLVTEAPLRPGSPDMRSTNASAEEDYTTGAQSRPHRLARKGSTSSITTWPVPKLISSRSIWGEIQGFLRRRPSGSGFNPGTKPSEPGGSTARGASSQASLFDEPSDMSMAEQPETHRFGLIPEMPFSESQPTTPIRQEPPSGWDQVDIGNPPISPVMNPIIHTSHQDMSSPKMVQNSDERSDINTVEEKAARRLGSAPETPVINSSAVRLGGRRMLSAQGRLDVGNLPSSTTSNSNVDSGIGLAPSIEVQPDSWSYPVEDGTVLHQPSLLTFSSIRSPNNPSLPSSSQDAESFTDQVNISDSPALAALDPDIPSDGSPSQQVKPKSGSLTVALKEIFTSFPSRFRRQDISIQDPSRLVATITSKDIKGAKRCGSGGSGVVWVLTHRSLGKIALKHLRVSGNAEQVAIQKRGRSNLGRPQASQRAAVLWSFGDGGRVVPGSPYVANGSLDDYLRNVPDADRPRFLHEAAGAVAYLHRSNIIHGDIKAANILISDDIHVLLCDFGLARSVETATSVGLQGTGTVAWKSPELFDNRGKTFESDVWAFGMIIYEVLSGRIPFDMYTPTAVMYAIVAKDERPPKLPTHSSKGLSYDRVWSVAEGCWTRDPAKRQSMDDAHAALEHACGLLTPITTKDIKNATRFNGGGSGVILVLSHPSAGKLALKRLHMPGNDTQVEKIRKYAFKEAEIWKTLQHANVLRFIELLELDGYLYLVSPYIRNGSLSDYLKGHPDANRPQLIVEVAGAIAFLHSRHFVHGDIKAANVLVSDDVHALLCDFGLTRSAHASTTTTSQKGKGTIRWESPEFMENGGGRTYASDVWAFGMTIYEVLSGLIPYNELQGDTAVLRAVCLLDQRPPKEPTHSAANLSYAPIWGVASDCWKKDPAERETMPNAHSRLQAAITPPSNDEIKGPTRL